jgi:phosphatidylinositol-3-phosphatase
MMLTKHPRCRFLDYVLGGARAGTALLALLVLVCLAACVPIVPAQKTPGGAAMPLPRYDHIVVVVEENHSYRQIVDAADEMPYFSSLARQGAVFTDAHGVTHPSQPNYLALFAGSTFDVTGDQCPLSLGGANLATALAAHNLTFTGYSEDLPQAGYTGCYDDPSAPGYARKHNPWVTFVSVPASSNQPFSAFPTDFSQLPTVAFVVPNQWNDMHSGSVAAADDWLRQNLGAYAQWAVAHNSLLIVTWDEDDGTDANHIPTIFVGAHVQPGRYGETIDHYDLLRTIEALEQVPFTNRAASASTISDVWQP